ncbi:MAG: adenylate/guanylate cyclase domain-containing protein [Rhodospirillales bacterium]
MVIGLRTKIFSAFFVVVALLLGFTLYFMNSQTTRFELERIYGALKETQQRFEDKFETERMATQKLVSTITSDQKYRSFLQQIRDNFYSFAQEIALDTGADLVFIIDEELEVRGSFGKAGQKPGKAQVAKYFTQAESLLEKEHVVSMLEGVLDSGKAVSRVIVAGAQLMNSVSVPLKESLNDDYALGVVSVGSNINDNWVTQLLGEEGQAIAAVFHVGGAAVASNVSKDERSSILAAADASVSAEGFELVGERFIMLRGSFENAGAPAGYVLAGSLDKAMAPFVDMQWKIFYAGLFLLVGGLGIMLFISNRIVFPIRLLVRGTEEVVSGNYDYRVDVRTRDEVGHLAGAFNTMTEGLQEKEQIRNLFGKYVHPTIIGDLMNNPDELSLGGHRRLQTLLFSDIAGFTSISENMNAEELVAFLNDYLGAMTEELAAWEGILDKYLGDGIMAFFGPPFTKENHALQACRAALSMQARLAEMREGWRAQGLPPLETRIGLATGDVIVGNIGSEQSQNYTCIGDTVNLSSRLEAVNKFYGTRIIISGDTLELAGDGVCVRELDRIQVKGREEGTRIFELVGYSGEVMDDVLKKIGQYEKALALYGDGDFAAAADAFEANAKDDTASRTMAERCRTFVDDPPGSWNGVFAMESK